MDPNLPVIWILYIAMLAAQKVSELGRHGRGVMKFDYL